MEVYDWEFDIYSTKMNRPVARFSWTSIGITATPVAWPTVLAAVPCAPESATGTMTSRTARTAVSSATAAPRRMVPAGLLYRGQVVIMMRSSVANSSNRLTLEWMLLSSGRIFLYLQCLSILIYFFMSEWKIFDIKIAISCNGFRI